MKKKRQDLALDGQAPVPQPGTGRPRERTSLPKIGQVPEHWGAIGVVRSGFWTLELGQMEGGTGGPEGSTLDWAPGH